MNQRLTNKHVPAAISMRRLAQIGLAVAGVVLGASLFQSCADNDMVQLTMQEPPSLAAYDYLRQYDVLKSYADVGVAMEPQHFLQKDMEYRLVVANFSQLQPADAYCHAQVVKTSGALSTSTIEEVAKLADQHGMTLLSSPLVWHRQQNVNFLNALLSPHVVRPEGDDGGYCMVMSNGAMGKAMTDAQVAYTFAKTPQVEPGIKYKLAFQVRGSVEGSVQVATYSNGKGSRFTPNVKVTREWTHVELTNSMASGIKGLTSILFNVGLYVGKLYVDNIELYEVDNKGNEVTTNMNTQNTNLDDAETTAASVSILTDVNGSLEDVGVSALGDGYDPQATYTEKTDEEKHAILLADMQRFVGGVMEAGGKTTSEWLVVNEPLAQADDDATAFYWQQYLGAVDYVAEAFKEAARHTEGTLYIGESSLESDLQSCETLTTLITQAEAQGARIDGIALPITAVVGATDTQLLGQVFSKLAATGKRIKIADLQVAFADDVATTDLTDAHFQSQADLLAAILKTYADHVPASQRSSIIQHQAVDTEAAPLGLWSSDYSRKHAYGSFVEGIK